MSFGKPKTVKPPTLPSLAATPTEISAQAARAGETERKLLRGRRGRESTILAPGLLMPARVERAGLKTTLG